MTTVEEMLRSHPQGSGDVDQTNLAECIRACFECAQACTACADACLGEQRVAELVTRISTDLACADLCLATGSVLSRHRGHDASLTLATLEACATACQTCRKECERHAVRVCR